MTGRHSCQGTSIMWGRKSGRRTASIGTLIGPDTTIQGDIRFSGGLHVEGVIRGNVYAENDGRSLLSLNEHGRIEGEVNVPYVVINGTVIGDVHGGEHVELSTKARVTGNVYYYLIEMAIGAEVNGKLVHNPVAAAAPSIVNQGQVFEA